ncbi:MAG: hypothetical protein ABIE42_03980 [Candidatus Eisenbacteria bacterium]
MKLNAMIALAVALLISLPAACLGQTPTASWYINDGPDAVYWWEDTSIGSFWEWMYSTAIDAGDDTCAISDLPSPYLPGQSLYAVSYPEINDYSACDFWAELYLDNNYGGYSEPVTVTLGTGTAGVLGSFVAVATPVTVFVTTSGAIDCGVAYTFNFGTVANCVLNGNSLILKIDNADTGGNTHIYWDSECCPSALHAYCPASPVEDNSWGVIKGLYR